VTDFLRIRRFALSRLRMHRGEGGPIAVPSRDPRRYCIAKGGMRREGRKALSCACLASFLPFYIAADGFGRCGAAHIASPEWVSVLVGRLRESRIIYAPLFVTVLYFSATATSTAGHEMTTSALKVGIQNRQRRSAPPTRFLPHRERARKFARRSRS